MPPDTTGADGTAEERPYRQEWVERGDDRLGLHLYPEPVGHPDAPVVVVVPAMGVPARYYRHLAGHLRMAGMSVAVADLRGTGTSTPRPGRGSRYGYLDLADDVGAVLAALKERRDGRRTVLLGHSLGGQACVLHLAFSGADEVDRLVLVASGLPWWRTFPGWHRLVLPAYALGIQATATLLGVWPGWTFGGRQARGVMRDWVRAVRTGRFVAPDGVDVAAALAGVRVPVLGISIENDRYAPPAVVGLLLSSLSGAPVRREHLTTADAGAPLDHFRWAREPRAVVDRVAAFVAD